MKPIPSPVGRDAVELLNKAQQLLAKAEELEMVEHEGKKVPAFAADGKGANDAKKAEDKECDECKGKGDDCKCSEKCPECGNAMNKMGCKMGGCGMKMEKSTEAGAQPGFATSFDSKPADVMFLAESGGQTRNAYYTTNQYPYTGEDVANKGSTSESFNLESISGKMNPHDGGGVDRQVVEGHLTKAQEMIQKAFCEQCGGNQHTGCRAGIPNCPEVDRMLAESMGEREHGARHDPTDYSRSVY